MIRKDIKEFLQTIPQDVTLVAASKYVDTQDIRALANVGINNIGENRVESFLINMKSYMTYLSFGISSVIYKPIKPIR